MERLIRDRIHIALVKDRAGHTLGMITLEDIIEELVGEIHDEFDRIPTHLNRAGDGWIAGGFVSLNQLRETAGIELELIWRQAALHAKRLGGRIAWSPAASGGESLQSKTCSITVRKTRNVMLQEAYLVKRAEH